MAITKLQPFNLNTSADYVLNTVTSTRLVSTVASGTAPLTVTSNTLVANLNADLLDGLNTASAATASTIVSRDANGSITANVFIGNIASIDGANVTGTVANATYADTAGTATTATTATSATTATTATTAGAVTTNAQPNITSVGTLTSLNITGNLVTGNTNAGLNLLLTGSSSGNVTLIAQAAASGTLTLPNGTDTVVATATSATLTNKRVTPRVANNGATTSGTITPTGDASDQFELIGLTGSITVATPSGTPTNGQKLLLKLKDNGSARTITWSSNYRIIGVTLPVATTASKVTYVGCVYNSQDSFWDVVAVGQQA